METQNRAYGRRGAKHSGVSHIRIIALSAMACWAFAGAGNVRAQTGAAFPSPAAIGWTALVDAAMVVRAGSAEAIALRAEAGARRALAQRRVSGPFETEGVIRQDIIGSGSGYREFEGGIGASLWRAGERAAIGSQANSLLILADSQLDVARLDVAGAIRAAWWALQLAESDAKVATQQVELARDLTATTERLMAAGEQSRLNLMQAQAALGEAEESAAQAIGRQASARVSLMGLVGQIPLTLPRERVGALNVDEHPLVRAALAQAAQLEQAAKLEQLRAQPAWRVGLDVRSERDGRGATMMTSTGIKLSRPFGLDPSISAQATTLQGQAVAARQQANALRNRLETVQAEAVVGVSAARAGYAATQTRNRASAEALALTELGYREGELAFLELIRARSVAANAARGVAIAEVTVDAAISAFNQAQGLLPEDNR